MPSLKYQDNICSPFRRYAWKTRSTSATVVCRWYTLNTCGYRAAGERSTRQRHLAKPDRGILQCCRYRAIPTGPRRLVRYKLDPIAGCSAVSPGCDNCWTMRAAAQLARMGGSTAARYSGLTRMERTGPVWIGEIRVRDDLLPWPLFRRQPRRIAVSLMSDLFHEAVITATLDRVHAVIAVAHWHTFLVLAKRSRRMLEYYGNPETSRRIAGEIDRLLSEILPSGGPGSSAAARTAAPAIPTSTRRIGRGRTVGTPRHRIDGFSPVMYGTPSTIPAAIRPVGLEPWPLPNLWPGVSVEGQSRIERIGNLLKTSAAARWVCFEPLLDRVMRRRYPPATGVLIPLPAGTTRSMAVAGRSLPRDPRGNHSTGWLRAEKSASGPARRTRTACARYVMRYS